jgi:hypothetical protein
LQQQTLGAPSSAIRVLCESAKVGKHNTQPANLNPVGSRVPQVPRIWGPGKAQLPIGAYIHIEIHRPERHTFRAFSFVTIALTSYP